MPKPLVVVESPAKAKTLSKFLGNDYDVRASVGHVADLPSKGLNIDVDNGFKPTYELTERGKTVIKELRAALKDASELYLATDEDREGEAISWHLLEYLKPKVPVKRMVFHEITKSAIDHAVNNPRSLDYGLVDAAETRRILDRLYGYEVSPVLWRRVNRGLSAGPCAEPVGSTDRAARARAHRVRVGRLLGHRRRHRHRAELHRQAGHRQRHQGRHRQGLRRSRRRVGQGGRPRRGPRPRDRRRSRRRALHGPFGRGEAVPVVAEGTVHDLDAAAGGRSQAAHVVVAGDARRPGSVRAWLHHLHAYRQRRVVRRGDAGDSRRRDEPVRPAVPHAGAEAVLVEGEERAGGPRGDPPDHAVPHPTAGQRRAEQPGPRAVPDDLAAHARLADGRRRPASPSACASGPTPSTDRPANWPTASSPPPARRSRSPATARSTRPAASRATRKARATPSRRRCCRRSPRATSCRSSRSRRRVTPRRRRPGTPRRRSSSDSRSSASAGRRRGRRSSRRSRTAGTCGRRVRRSSRPGPPSPSSVCSRSTSTRSSTTTSPPRSTRTSTRSPAATAPRTSG